MKVSIAADLPMGLEGDILKSLRIPLAVIENEFHYLWLNQEMARLYRTQPEQVTGQISYRISHHQAGPCHDCPVAAAQKSRRREISQKYEDFPDVIRKYGEVSAFPIYGPQKEVAAILIMIIDITDKIVVDMDAAYQMLARLMPSLQGSIPQAKHPYTPKRVNGRSGRPRTEKDDLTHRETQVLHLLTKGYSNLQGIWKTYRTVSLLRANLHLLEYGKTRFEMPGKKKNMKKRSFTRIRAWWTSD